MLLQHRFVVGWPPRSWFGEGTRALLRWWKRRWLGRDHKLLSGAPAWWRIKIGEWFDGRIASCCCGRASTVVVSWVVREGSGSTVSTVSVAIVLVRRIVVWMGWSVIVGRVWVVVWARAAWRLAGCARVRRRWWWRMGRRRVNCRRREMVGWVWVNWVAVVVRMVVREFALGSATQVSFGRWLRVAIRGWNSHVVQRTETSSRRVRLKVLAQELLASLNSILL